MRDEEKADVIKQLYKRRSEAGEAVNSVPAGETGAYYYGMATAFLAAIKILEGEKNV